MLYKTIKEWAEAAKYRLRQFAEGLCGVLFYILIMGIVSLVVYAITNVKAFYERERKASIVFAVMVILLLWGWISTFVSERATAVKYSHKTDSLSYELSKFRLAFDEGDSIIIGNDTITIKYWTHEE